MLLSVLIGEELKTYQYKSNQKDNKTSNLLSELTSRQKQVYDLILSDKTNKEIMAELYIEQSTLKSHINQIVTTQVS